jgi:uncharacterized protein YbjT (DUF2867 family)
LHFAVLRYLSRVDSPASRNCVLVTGATGFVGRAILDRLHQAGYRLRILARNPASQAAEAVRLRYGLEVLGGDVVNAASLRGCLEGADAVIHLVGIISEAGSATFEKVHVRAAENLVAEAQASQVKRFVHMSALGTRPNAISRYHQTKWAAEETVRNSRLDYTIFRPSLIYGPEDQFVNLFARMIRWSPVVPLIGNRQTRFQPVAVEVVANAFTRALQEPGAIGRTLDLCGLERLTLREILDTILGVMHRRRWVVPIPSGVARAQATLLEWLFPRLLRRASPLNRDQLLMLEENNVGNREPAEQLLQLEQPGFRDGISRYLAPRR